MGKILLVENTGLVRIKFKKTLEKFGYAQANTLSSSESMSSTCEGIIKHAGIIFIDSDNRASDYGDILSYIKTKNKKAYIVGITSQGNEDYIKYLLRLGSHDVLAKPYSDNKLMEKVFKYLAAPTLDDVGDTKQSQIVEDKGRYMPVWNEDLELGLENIDHEHRELIEHYETLYQKMKTGEGSDYCRELLVYLNKYIDTHFKNEEEFLYNIKYDKNNEHTIMHDKFKDEIARIADEFDKDKIDVLSQVRFNLFVKNWWMHHILVEDKQYVDFYKSQNKDLKH